MSQFHPKENRSRLILEISLIIVTLGLTALLYETTGFGVTVLNLFFLPIVLAGFFLGRYRAGVLALLSGVSAASVVMLNVGNFAVFLSPQATALALTIWAAVLGLTALLVGTLSDEFDAKTTEAREAHLGVVEVLASYLQSANNNMESKARRIAELSEKVAISLRLPEKEVDDIRVAALLLDIENIEITSRVIRKAVGVLGESKEQNTFAGSELVQSLGNVLTGAFPLLINQVEADEPETTNDEARPLGACIIRTVREYETQNRSAWSGAENNPLSILEQLQSEDEQEHHPAVLHALEKVLQKETEESNAVIEAEITEEEPAIA